MASQLAKKVLNPIREKVSADRMRFEDGEYNLDLAYILPNIIAMGFPGEGLKSVWRNHIDEVSKMLNKYHEYHYRIWNLSEISYDYTKFHNQVVEYGFPDHHNPPLDLLFKIISSMFEWLQADTENVVVVHCVGGKGRTGTVIACFIMYSGVVDEPLKALDFFAERRSKKKKGVTQPSQRRYVHYFSEILHHQLRPFARPLFLHRIVINFAPNFASKHAGFKPALSIYQTTDGRKLIYETTPVSGIYPFYAEGTTVVINIGKHVAGDVLMNCYHKSKQLDKKVFRCAFHTAFINDYVEVFTREDLDDTKKNIQRFSSEFNVMLIFTEPEGKYETGESPELSEAYLKVFRKMPKRRAPNPHSNLTKKQVRYSCVDPSNRTVRYSFLHEGPGPLILDAGGGRPITITPPSKPLPPTPQPKISKPLPQPLPQPSLTQHLPQHSRPTPPARSLTYSSPEVSTNDSSLAPPSYSLSHSGDNFSSPTGGTGGSGGAPGTGPGSRQRAPSRLPPSVPPPSVPHVPAASFNGSSPPPATVKSNSPKLRPASVFRAVPKQHVSSAPSLSFATAPSSTLPVSQATSPSQEQLPHQTAGDFPLLPHKIPSLPSKGPVSRVIHPPPSNFDPTFGGQQIGTGSEGSFAIITGIRHLEAGQTDIASPPHHPSLHSIPQDHPQNPHAVTPLPTPDYPILPPHPHHPHPHPHPHPQLLPSASVPSVAHPLQEHQQHSNSDHNISYSLSNSNAANSNYNSYYQAPSSGSYYAPSDLSSSSSSWDDPYQQQGYQQQQQYANPYQHQYADPYQQQYPDYNSANNGGAPPGSSMPVLPPKRPPRT